MVEGRESKTKNHKKSQVQIPAAIRPAQVQSQVLERRGKLGSISGQYKATAV